MCGREKPISRVNTMTFMLNDPTLEAFLERLHQQSRGQSPQIDEHFSLLSRTDRTQPLVDADAKAFLAEMTLPFDGGFEFSVKCR
jgi:hypothetical protein